MPGRGSYGSGGKWIHDRAHRIMESTTKEHGEKEGKSIAYAIATQQAHKTKKSPKKHRTATGVRVAKRKYNQPLKMYRKTAMATGFFDELEKIGKFSIENLPIPLIGRALQMDEGERKHKQRLRALREGYPVGWVAAGMMPKRR